MNVLSRKTGAMSRLSLAKLNNFLKELIAPSIRARIDFPQSHMIIVQHIAVCGI